MRYKMKTIDILKRWKNDPLCPKDHFKILDGVIDDILLLENNYQVLKDKNIKLKNVIDEQRKRIDNKLSTKVRRCISNELFKWSKRFNVEE